MTRVTLMPIALAASSSPFSAMHWRPYLLVLKNAASAMASTAETNASGSPTRRGMPVRPDAPPVRVVIRFSRAAIASPKPSVTSEI